MLHTFDFFLILHPVLERGFYIHRIPYTFSLFQDVNECNNHTRCPENAMCVNMKGSFECRCKSGFYGQDPHKQCSGKRIKRKYSRRLQTDRTAVSFTGLQVGTLIV